MKQTAGKQTSYNQIVSMRKQNFLSYKPMVGYELLRNKDSLPKHKMFQIKYHDVGHTRWTQQKNCELLYYKSTL